MELLPLTQGAEFNVLPLLLPASNNVHLFSVEQWGWALV